MLHDRSSSHRTVWGIVKHLKDERLGYTACTPMDVRKFIQTKYLVLWKEVLSLTPLLHYDTCQLSHVALSSVVIQFQCHGL